MKNIQRHYRLIKENGKHAVVNELLMSMMVPVPQESSRKNQRWMHKVPSLHDGEPGMPQWCRIFYPCRKQFMSLFGLTESRLSRLAGRGYYSDGYKGPKTFRWGGPTRRDGMSDVYFTNQTNATYVGREL